jgi:hypothetical protein
MAQILLIIGSLIFGLLGTMHLIYTFFSNKFDPRNIEVKLALENTYPIISNETSMWRSLVGFHVSHSVGAILVALFFIPLSVFYNEVLQNSLWFSLLPTAIGFCYLILAKKYWFKRPLIGISLATFFFLGSSVFYNL